MGWVHSKNFHGYFGNIENNLQVSQHYDPQLFYKLINKIKIDTELCATHLIFPKQIHTANILTIKNKQTLHKPLNLFLEEADAIITQEKNIAIGVATADCLPIFLYDPKNEVIGTIHAGWRGLSTKIITKTISSMQSQFQSHPEDILTYIGPSAKVCCYEVQSDFLKQFFDAHKNNCITQQSNKMYFDPLKSATAELIKNDLLMKNINIDQSICTICHDHFCSVRRQKEKAGRQPSFAILS